MLKNSGFVNLSECHHIKKDKSKINLIESKTLGFILFFRFKNIINILPF